MFRLFRQFLQNATDLPIIWFAPPSPPHQTTQLVQPYIPGPTLAHGDSVLTAMLCPPHFGSTVLCPPLKAQCCAPATESLVQCPRFWRAVSPLSVRCPCCKHALVAERRFGQTVDACHNCEGLWLDATELGALVRQTPVSTDIRTASRNCRQGLRCPRCFQALTPFNYAHDSGVHINRCDRCDGVWLEPGQLDLLVRYRNSTTARRALADAWSEELKKPAYLQSLRRILHSRVLSGGVAALQVIGQFIATGKLHASLSLLIALLFPLLCIWHAEAMGRLTGVALYGPQSPRLTHTTPADFVAIGSWSLLFAIFIASFTLR